jgi:DNA polymerase-1
MIKVAMVHLDNQILSSGTNDISMILQVHDELVFEVTEGHVDEWTSRIVEAMKSALPLSVPIEVGVSFGKNWGDMSK